MDQTPVTAKSLGRSYMIDAGTLEHAYKYTWSGFLGWEHRSHADNWVLLPDNLGPHLSIDESCLHDDLFTIVTNKEGHGRSGTIVAMVRGTKAEDVIKVLMQIPEEERKKVKEVTMDLSESMRSIIEAAFPDATITLDCFHIMKRCLEAVEELRLRYKREAQAEINREMRLPFQMYPKLKELYDIVNKLRSIFRSKKLTRDDAKAKLHKWYQAVADCTIREIKSARDAIKSREENVLNYFIERSTNASAESFNSKLKAFRAQLRGIRGLPFFIFRICKVFG